MESLPPVLADRAAFLLRLALGRAEQMGERALATAGLTGREYGALALLAGGDMSVQRALGAVLGLDRTTTAALLRHLEDAGLVSRRRDPANRRAYKLTLTAEGEKRRAAAADVLHACDDRFLEVLSGTERAELIRLLSKLAAEPED
jgi:DNA-binding MarR family transcriptional regulator